MNALIMIRIENSQAISLAETSDRLNPYSGTLLSILDGVSNLPERIAQRIGGIGRATVTLGKIVASNGYLHVLAHSPTFDMIRDRLGDMYMLRAFPASPHICVARILSESDEEALSGINVDQFAGLQYTFDDLVISDDQVWYEHPVSLVEPFTGFVYPKTSSGCETDEGCKKSSCNGDPECSSGKGLQTV